MGFFNKDNGAAVPSASLAPLTKDRIKSVLERLEIAYSVDSDGDVGAGWEAGSFFFLVEGQSEELLCVRGQWRARLTPSEYGQAIEVCNDWNRETRWPKTYARHADEDTVAINAELNIDFEQGVTDEQLQQQIQCVVSTGLSFFDKLNETFPAAWEQYRPES